MNDATHERRKGQRVEANLKLEVSIPRPDGSQAPVSMETLNISSSGIYFRSDHFIEPMTKLDMVLELPTHKDEKGRTDQIATARCEGIVVRVLPETDRPDVAHYEVAVFFTQINEEGLSHLSDHINMLLAVG
ncbi:PilZ domain-containing protein [bacterium]|nr:PilZ domain-containing protein [bacterium]MBU1073950.1 PilZ domain-containing protein [bacterium]MBU1675724.1 PilZ domain-containing protein [bacterium]